MSPIASSARRSRRWFLLVGLLLALAATLTSSLSPGWADGQATAPAKGPETASWTVLDAVTTIGLDTKTLSLLGLEMEDVEKSVTRHEHHPLSIIATEAPSFGSKGLIGLRAAVAADGFHGFEGGSLYLRGGFRLRGKAGSFDLSGMELRPGGKAGSLELVDATGLALFTTAEAQWEFDAERGLVRYLNADVRILPALAERLGDERYTGMNVGILDLDATLRVGPVPRAPQPAIGIAAPPPCGDWSGNVDVGLVDMSSIGQAGIATVNGRSVVVVLPSAELQNVGTANVPWYSKFTNLGVAPWNDQHPFLVWQMVRVNGGVLEPLGKSDLKHAFLTLNNGCAAGACTDSHVLGINCADVYSTGTNNSVGSLAPRSEVTASTGIWAHCGGIVSHFDQNGDCVQDYSGAGENAFTHGLKVAETDLQVAGASYYVEAFYIVRNDVNIFNSMGYRKVTPAKPGSVWTFTNAAAYSQGPAINAWVNPVTPGANADNRLLDTGEGHVQLAVRVTDIAGGKKRFAYALQNHDFDRRIRSFKVPFNTGVGVIENIAFADGDGFAANDWVPTVDATGITWTIPAGAVNPPAELDYATVISFRFDSDQGVAPVTATLGVADAGSPMALTLQSLAPSAPIGISGSDFYTLPLCRLLDTRTAQGGGSALASGSVLTLDVLAAGCGVPANAVAIAVNLTAIGATSGGDVSIYAVDPPSSPGTISFGPGATRANNAVAMISVDGKVKIQPNLSPPGTTHVALDVVGYFVPSP